MKLFNKIQLIGGLRQHVRSYVVKRSFPVDPMAANDVPVDEYPRRREQDRVVYVWGLAEHGALGQYLQKRKKMKNRGDKRFFHFFHPLRLHFGETHSVTHLAAGYGFTAFAVNSPTNNKVFGTGVNTDSQIGCHEPRNDFPLGILLSPAPIGIPFKHPTTTKVTAMSAGRAHLVICTDAEGVFTLGNNSYGQCGRRIVENEKYTGSKVVHRIRDLGGEKVVGVECGQDHTLFLTETGRVWSCGWGADGQTGLGQYHSQGEPKRLLGDIQGEKIVKLSSKADCVLALNDKGDVFGWGNSEYSQIFKQGDERQQVCSPVHVTKCRGFGKIVDVAASGSHCVMLNEDGEVFTWGYGLLGRGPEAYQSWQPERIPPILFGRNEFQPLSRVTSVHTGLNFSAAITNYGDVYMWGKNRGGCLGLGHEQNQFFPLRVSMAAIAQKLALGVDHSVALCKIV